MKSPAIVAAQALLPILSPFQEVGCTPLKSVQEFLASDIVCGIALNFGSMTLLIEMVSEDDTVVISTRNRPTVIVREIDVTDRGPWRELIGQNFCWGWVTINQQGYLDGVMLSFSDLNPRIVINAVASELKVGQITMSAEANQ